MKNHLQHVAIIGNGRWGEVFFRNFCLFSAQVEQLYIVSQNKEKYTTMVKGSPIKTSLISCIDELSNLPIDGVVIATPPSVRLEIIKKILPFCRTILCEKPLALTMEEANEIVALVKKTQCQFIVDYVHLFSNEFAYLKKNVLLQPGFKLYSQSGNQGPIREYSALWDYGPHDLSLMLALTQEMPEKMDVKMISSPRSEGLSCQIHLFFKKGEAMIDISNLREDKKRFLQVVSNDTWVLDDTKAIEKLHHNGVPVHLKNIPPLQNAIEFFLNPAAIGYESDFFLALSRDITHVLSQCEMVIKKACSLI